MVHDPDSDSDGPIGYVDAPRDRWSNPDENSGAAPTVGGPSQPAQIAHPPPSPSASPRINPTVNWEPRQFAGFHDYLSRTRSDEWRARIKAPRRWATRKNCLPLAIVAFVLLVVFQLVAVGLSSEGHDRMKFYPELEYNVDVASRVTIGFIAFELIMGFSFVLWSGSVSCMVVFIVFIGISALPTGVYLTFAAKANLDNALCDTYGGMAARCWTGLRLGMAAGVFRVLVFPSVGLFLAAASWV